MIPKFNRYACFGDSITWQSGPFEMRAKLEYDQTTQPTDYECYSELEIAQFNADDWHFCGVVVTASISGVELGEAALWGVEMNFPPGSNDYLSEVAGELESEAISEAKDKLAEIIKRAA